MKTARPSLLFAVFLGTCGGCASTHAGGDPLPSWNDGATKQRIVEFVRRVTTPGSEDFVAPAERIATFDNDGTLWAEKPTYFQVAFVFARVAELAPQHPEWRSTQPFQAVLEKDTDALAHLEVADLLKLVTATHAGMTQAEFQVLAERFLATARHPRFGTLYKDTIYQPQLELLAYLRDHGFRVFICSGGGVDFIRTFSLEAYGIPPENVIGSTIELEWQRKGDRFVLQRLPAVDHVNDKKGKPVSIQRRLGRRPLIAVGNSDGDLEMMHFTADRAGPSLCLLLHHDDAAREYDYDKGTERALEVAAARGWTVISMAADFKRVFPDRAGR